MRLLSSLFTVLTLLFLSSAAFAQDADIQWKDLSASERQGILNTWRALPQDQKGPFILYREEAIKSLSDEKKARYAETAKERAAREEASQAAYEKRQAEEAKIEKAKEATRKAEQIDDIAKPVAPTIKTPEAIKPLETKPIEAIKPAEVAKPAVMNDEQKAEEDASATEKAKELLNKFF